MLAVVLGFVSAIGSFVTVRVIKHYEALDERRQREELLKLR
jgi:hypothetical protein